MAIEKARTDRMQRSMSDMKQMEEMKIRQFKLMENHTKK